MIDTIESIRLARSRDHEKIVTGGATTVTTVRTVIHDRRIEVPAPEELPDGTEVVLTIKTQGNDDDGPMSPEEIAHVLSSMARVQSLEIPDDVEADLAEWERKLDQHSIENADKGIEDVFR